MRFVFELGFSDQSPMVRVPACAGQPLRLSVDAAMLLAAHTLAQDLAQPAADGDNNGAVSVSGEPDSRVHTAGQQHSGVSCRSLEVGSEVEVALELHLGGEAQLPHLRKLAALAGETDEAVLEALLRLVPAEALCVTARIPPSEQRDVRLPQDAASVALRGLTGARVSCPVQLDGTRLDAAFAALRPASLRSWSLRDTRVGVVDVGLEVAAASVSTVARGGGLEAQVGWRECGRSVALPP